MRRHGPVIAHCTDSENFPKFVWSNSRKKAGIDCFYKELHVATVATATIIIRRRTTLGPCSPTLRKLFVFCNHNSDTLV